MNHESSSGNLFTGVPLYCQKYLFYKYFIRDLFQHCDVKHFFSHFRLAACFNTEHVDKYKTSRFVCLALDHYLVWAAAPVIPLQTFPGASDSWRSGVKRSPNSSCTRRKARRWFNGCQTLNTGQRSHSAALYPSYLSSIKVFYAFIQPNMSLSATRICANTQSCN